MYFDSSDHYKPYNTIWMTMQIMQMWEIEIYWHGSRFSYPYTEKILISRFSYPRFKKLKKFIGLIRSRTYDSKIYPCSWKLYWKVIICHIQDLKYCSVMRFCSLTVMVKILVPYHLTPRTHQTVWRYGFYSFKLLTQSLFNSKQIIAIKKTTKDLL